MAAVPSHGLCPDWGPCAPTGTAARVYTTNGHVVILRSRHDCTATEIEEAVRLTDPYDFWHILYAEVDTLEESQGLKRFGHAFYPCKARGTYDLRQDLFASMQAGELHVLRFPLEDPIGEAEAFDPAMAETGPAAGQGLTPAEIAGMGMGRRALAAMASANFKEAATDTITDLMQPSNLGIMAGVMAALVGVAMVGGPVGAAIVAGVCWAAVGWSAWEIGALIWDFVKAINAAKTQADLTAAGRIFANLILTLLAVIPLLKLIGMFKRIGSRLREAGGKIIEAAKDIRIEVDPNTLGSTGGNVKITRKKGSSLIGELANAGIKHTPEDIVKITRTPEGKVVFLEKGNDAAGFRHILNHADDFRKKGISEEKLPDFIIKNLEEGKIVGYQGKGKGRPIYETLYDGVTHRTAITVGNNGFIVGANPVSMK